MCGLRRILVLGVVAGDTWRATGVKELALPHGWDGGGTCTKCYLGDCAHELEHAGVVADGVGESEADNETSTSEMGNLHWFILIKSSRRV